MITNQSVENSKSWEKRKRETTKGKRIEQTSVRFSRCVRTLYVIEEQRGYQERTFCQNSSHKTRSTFSSFCVSMVHFRTTQKALASFTPLKSTTALNVIQHRGSLNVIQHRGYVFSKICAPTMSFCTISLIELLSRSTRWPRILLLIILRVDFLFPFQYK